MTGRPSKEFGQLDTRGSRRALLDGIANDASMAVEVGAALNSNDAAEARAFMDATPDYFADRSGLNFAALTNYLEGRNLLFNRANLATAWRWLKANRRAVTREIAAADASPDSYRAIDGMSDRDVATAFGAMVEARARKRLAAEKLFKRDWI